MDKTIGYVGLRRLINSGYVIEFLLVHDGVVVFQCFGLMGYNQPPRTTVGLGSLMSVDMMKAFEQVSSGVLSFLVDAYLDMLTINAQKPIAALPLPRPVTSKLGLPQAPLLPPLPTK